MHRLSFFLEEMEAKRRTWKEKLRQPELLF